MLYEMHFAQLKRISLAWWILLSLVVLLSISAVYQRKSANQKFLDGKIVYPDSSYSVEWRSAKKLLNVYHDKSLLAQVPMPERPLAIWLKQSSGTLAIVTSEDGSLEANQILYIWKNGELGKLYHNVSGYDEKKGLFNRRFYDINQNSPYNIEDLILITPREELVVTKELQDYGFHPRVFVIDSRHFVSSYFNIWKKSDLHWSADGRCFILWSGGDTATSGGYDQFGYFQTPTDFVSYDLASDTVNRRNVQIKWTDNARCEGYLSMVADSYGGEGAPDFVNKQYNYHFGQDIPDHLQEVPALPKNFSQLPESKPLDQKLIYVTYK